jgi:predicted O-methyltransferase YrrM
MKALMKFLLPFFYRKWSDIQFRLSSLEIAVDSLIVSPKYSESDDASFNGQTHRRAIFKQLLEEFPFEAILETGTHVGSTTGYMATTAQLPVYTCELNKRYYYLAKMRLHEVPNINMALLDSRAFLRTMARTAIVHRFVFVYLDAHWYDDLPLQQEVELVCDNWNDFVIMIDDFAVPGDKGYGYDNYGRKKTLALKTFARTFVDLDLVPFFPSLASAQETGSRRGCVILSRRGPISDRLITVRSLRMHGR